MLPLTRKEVSGHLTIPLSCPPDATDVRELIAAVRRHRVQHDPR